MATVTDQEKADNEPADVANKIATTYLSRTVTMAAHWRVERHRGMKYGLGPVFLWAKKPPPPRHVFACVGRAILSSATVTVYEL
jgi:hypothetical protein